MFGFINSSRFQFIFVFLISALFRLTYLNLIEFKGDEATNLYLAAQPLFGNPMPYGGTLSSVGILNPPIFNYFLFLFTLLSLDPKVISFMIGSLNSLALAFLFLIIKRFYNTRIALITTTLFAFSPWAIIYSRKIWPQDFIILLLVPLLYSIHKIVKENNAKYWVLYTFLSIFLIQLHQSGLFFVPLLTIFLLLNKAKINIKAILVGCLIGIIPLIPYISFEISNKCPDCKAYVAAKKSLSGRFPIVFIRPLQILSQGDFQFLLYDDMEKFSQSFPFAFNLRRIFYIEYLLVPLGLFLFWKKNKKYRLFVYTSIFLPLLYFLSSIVPHMHYFIVLMPFLFLFLGFSLYSLISDKKLLVKYFGVIILISILFTSLIFDFSFFNFLGQKKNIRGDYGTVFSVTEKKAKDNLKGFEEDPKYEEMLLASYIPKNAIYGNQPLGKMLYPYNKIKNQIPSLDKRLAKVPVDEEVKRELIAYYTSSKPTEDTIKLLKQKTQTISGYKDVLLEVETLYVNSKNNK